MPNRNHKYQAHIEVGGQQLPVDLVLEPRYNTRYSITRKRIVLRMPHQSRPEHVRQGLADLQVWVEKQFERKPTLKFPFIARSYKTGDILQVGDRRYVLDISHDDRATHTARLVGDTICVTLSTRVDEAHRSKSMRTLLSRVVGSDFFPDIKHRVEEINRQTVNRPLRGIFLKYHHSKWGSCSNDGNINLSTRLLFAPGPVRDYVILHELAHLVELNHSDRFWSILDRFMPDYPVYEKWLKENGGYCDF